MVVWPGNMGRIDDNHTISDISEAKGKGDAANGPVLHLKRGFFSGGMSEIHSGTPVI
jgi:hypothetical protein